MIKYVEKFPIIYEPHFKMCDDILKCLSDDVKPDVDLNRDDFLAEPDSQVIPCIKTLEKDGYIIRKNEHRKVQVTGEGIAFRKLNGYKYKFQYEDHLGWMAEKQLQSTIDANESTHKLNNDLLPKSLNSQKGLSKLSLVLAGLSILFIGITACIQYQDKTPQRITELKQELQETKRTLDNIQLSLQEINSSIQKIKTDSVWVNRR